MQPEVLDVLFVLDFDRTLSEEARIDEAMQTACRDVGIDTDQLKKAKNELESSGESFSTLDYLYATQPKDVVERVKAAFMTTIQEQSPLYPDAVEFLKLLKAQSIASVILTLGTQEWQELKIIGSQLHEQVYEITDEKEKGKIIDSWRDADGIYQLPFSADLVARQIILVDDKAKSFTGLPEDCRGFLIRRPNEPELTSQMGETPPNVRTVSSLVEIAAQLSQTTV